MGGGPGPGCSLWVGFPFSVCHIVGDVSRLLCSRDGCGGLAELRVIGWAAGDVVRGCGVLCLRYLLMLDLSALLFEGQWDHWFEQQRIF